MSVSAKPSTKHQVTSLTNSKGWLRNKTGFALWREHELFTKHFKSSIYVPSLKGPRAKETVTP